MVMCLYYCGQNNLFKVFNEWVQLFFDSSCWSSGLFDFIMQLVIFVMEEICYQNSFSCVWCGVIFMLIYDLCIDLLCVYLMMVWVVGLKNEEVYCDEFGCIKVQLLGFNFEDYVYV